MLAFECVFIPAWNSGKLTKVYYHEGREFKYNGMVFKQLWDVRKDQFYYLNTTTNEKRWMNPALEVEFRSTLLDVFKKYDADLSGYLELEEMKKLMLVELAMDLTQGK